MRDAGPGRFRRRLALTGLLAIPIWSGCGDPRLDRVRPDADEYIRAIQHEDAVGVVKRLSAFRAEIAGRPRSEWEEIRARHAAVVRQRFAGYQEAQSSSLLTFHEDGITLLKALAVGKGVYYLFEDLRPGAEAGRAVGTMLVNLDYSPNRFEGLPPGTRVFLMGEPLGKLHTLILGRTAQERTVRLVHRILLEWTLVWYPGQDVYPDGWAVESVRPREDRVEFTDVTRVWGER